MLTQQIRRPIGLKAFCAAVEDVCRNAALYRRIGPRPLIVQLDQGSGRTTGLAYMAQLYRFFEVLPFKCGLDDYVEVTLDGSSPEKICQGFACFEDAAIYENQYSNIAALDIANVARYLNGQQLTEFLRCAGHLCETACTVFFVPSCPSDNEERLLQKLADHVGNIQRIAIGPYTLEELCCLLERRLISYGAEISRYPSFHKALLNFAETAGLSNVKDTLIAADALMHYADFSHPAPIVSRQAVSAMTAFWLRTNRKGVLK